MLMPSDRPHADRLFAESSPSVGDRFDVRGLLRQRLLLAGLVLVTCCRYADDAGQIALPATWLMFVLLVLTGWSCSRRLALSASVLVLLAWSVRETIRDADGTQLVFGQDPLVDQDLSDVALGLRIGGRIHPACMIPPAGVAPAIRFRQRAAGDSVCTRLRARAWSKLADRVCAKASARR